MVEELAVRRFSNTAAFRWTVRATKGYRSLLRKSRRGRWGEHMPEHILPKNSTPPRRTRLRSFSRIPISSLSSPRSSHGHAVPSSATKITSLETARSRCSARQRKRSRKVARGEETDGAPRPPISHQRRACRRCACNTAINRKLTTFSRARQR